MPGWSKALPLQSVLNLNSFTKNSIIHSFHLIRISDDIATLAITVGYQFDFDAYSILTTAAAAHICMQPVIKAFLHI
jgi:hypothetical protein